MPDESSYTHRNSCIMTTMNASDLDCRPVGTIAVIGGGASGILATIHLLSRAARPVDVVVVEPGGRLGGGVAYSTTEPTHLLNAPTSEMSAWSDRPDDFTAFVGRHGYCSDGMAFVPRQLYRDYLIESLAAARSRERRDSGAELLAEEAIALIRPTGVTARRQLVVGLRHGSHLPVDHVILAVGPPATVAPWLNLETPIYDPKLVVDPWCSDALEAIERDDRVLLLGSGLTAVDVVLSLEARGHRGKLLTRSRHGLLPQRQTGQRYAAISSNLDASTRTARELFSAVRVAAEKASYADDDWRAIVAGLRDELPRVWDGLGLAERDRLLRHAQRYWEIHRHRIAPAVGVALDRVLESGRLDVAPGRLVSLERTGESFAAGFDRAGHAEEVAVDAIVNCTGPAGSYQQNSRLVDQLLRTGTATVDPSGLGLSVDNNGDLLDERGAVDAQIHTLGWPRRGRLYESSAIPEIRGQAETLAERLVGGGQ
jgi:uncharacterized NAD(P)/FAD-binding protein YdhS